MLAQEIENDKVKCVRYWPETTEKAKLDKMTIKLISKETTRSHIVRTFQIKLGRHHRTVTHLQYLKVTLLKSLTTKTH